ncbi:MAG: SRPBCC domain-containing protein [Acidimicrobiia bacterium]
MSGNGYEIRAQFTAERPPAEIKRWLDTASGIAGWWSDDVRGEAARKGDEFEVRFPSSPVVFRLEVTEATDDMVEWRVPDSPPWWRGTTISFRMSEGEEGGTTLLFTHGGFAANDPIIEVITPAWVRFVDNLMAVAESGKPNPAVVN